MLIFLPNLLLYGNKALFDNSITRNTGRVLACGYGHPDQDDIHIKAWNDLGGYKMAAMAYPHNRRSQTAFGDYTLYIGRLMPSTCMDAWICAVALFEVMHPMPHQRHVGMVRHHPSFA